MFDILNPKYVLSNYHKNLYCYCNLAWVKSKKSATEPQIDNRYVK